MRFPLDLRYVLLATPYSQLRTFINIARKKLRSECKSCSKTKNKKYFENNKQTLNQKQKEWNSSNKQKVRNSKLKRKFGINLEEKEKLFSLQNHQCAICKTKENIRDRDWDVDHCHITGKVRGILCSNCNRGLGLFKDDPSTLLSAFAYLKKHVEHSD